MKKIACGLLLFWSVMFLACAGAVHQVSDEADSDATHSVDREFQERIKEMTRNIQSQKGMFWGCEGLAEWAPGALSISLADGFAIPDDTLTTQGINDVLSTLMLPRITGDITGEPIGNGNIKVYHDQEYHFGRLKLVILKADNEWRLIDISITGDSQQDFGSAVYLASKASRVFWTSQQQGDADNFTVSGKSGTTDSAHVESQPGAESEPKPEPPKQENQEAAAQRALALAKNLLKAGRPATTLLQRVVERYPNTAAAQEAASLLE